MKFIVPYDQIGTTPPGPWQNAAPSSGVEGSIPNADFFPAVQNEILNAIQEAGLTPNAADFTQLLQALRSGALTCFADTGTADAMIVTPVTAYTALALGAPIQVLKGNAANATVTPTLTVGSLTRQITKEDGSALAASDLPAGCLFSVISDGTKFRVVGLRKSDAAAAAGSSTVVSTAIQNYVSLLTPKGSTKISAFTANKILDDVQSASFSTTQVTGNFTGASYVDASGDCAFRDVAATGTEGSCTARLCLTDVTTGSTGQSQYVGSGSYYQNTQISLVVARVVWNLNPAHVYNLSLQLQKNTVDGQVQSYDAYIFGQHDGTNL